MSLKIGITQSETNYANYPKWIKGQEDIDIIELSYDQNNIQDVALCDGVVLTGGVDSHPKFYLNDYDLNYPHAPKEFAPHRDEFEFAVLDAALKHKKPILGICRGLQVINVFFKGTLHVDIGENNNATHKMGHPDASGKANNNDKEHPISVEKDSLFFNIVHKEKGIVNSAHHQAIDILGTNLKVSAVSDDNIIEAIELADAIRRDSYGEKQFLLAVQWHPERMTNPTNPFTKNIRKAFLKASSRKKPS